MAEGIEVPPRSRLFRLAPIGLGTPLSESLASYVARLAETHGWSVQRLVSYHIVPQTTGRYGPLGGGRSFWEKQGRMANGFGIGTKRWVEALQTLTCREGLQDLTLLRWQSVLSLREAMRKHRAWCPSCFEDWRHDLVYEPLLWCLACVTHCPIHRRELISLCPRVSCQAALPILDAQLRTGFCSRCFSWLGVPRRSRVSRHSLQRVPPCERWMVNAVGELIAASGQIDGHNSIRAFPEVLRECAVVWGHGTLKQLARTVSMPPSLVTAWARSTHRPSLLWVLGMCLQLRITPLRLLTSAPGSLAVHKRHHRHKATDWRVPGDRARGTRDLESLSLRLKRILARREKVPPTLPAVAKEVGCESWYLLQEYPGLCQRIRDRAKRYRQNRAKTRLAQLGVSIRGATQTLFLEGRYPSARRVQQVLQKPALFKHPLLAEVWRETKRKLGIIDK